MGGALVFAAVCCEATYTLVGKQLTADLSPLTIATFVSILATVLFAPLAVWDALHMSWSEPGPSDWAAVLWWGVGTFALGSWLWFEGMKRTTPASASAFMAVMPISALVLSYVLLGETVEWVHAAGMGLTLVGLIAVVRRRIFGALIDVAPAVIPVRRESGRAARRSHCCARRGLAIGARSAARLMSSSISRPDRARRATSAITRQLDRGEEEG